MLPVAEPTASPAAVRLAPALVIAAVIIGLAFAQGGFFPQSWGWSALVLLLVAFLGITLWPRIELSALELGAVAAMSALLGWTLLSGLWADGFTLPVSAAERLLVYLATLLACLLGTRRADRATLAVGVWAGVVVVCVYSLGTRLLPERWGFFVDVAAHGRLYQPVGYWNGLAVLAGTGLLLGLGLAARSPHAVLRLAAGASLPVTASVVYLTFSRGGWLGLAVGVIAVLAVDRERLGTFTRMAALGVPPLLCVAAASRSHGLTSPYQKLSHASHAGHRYLLILLVVMLMSAGVTAWLWSLRSFTAAPKLRQAYMGALVVLAVLVFAGVVGRFGAPWAWPHKLYQQTGTATDTPGLSSLNQRLSSASLSGRGPLWHGALHEFEHHPLAGGGSGSFAAYWAQHQTSNLDANNAHSLYLETLAELGVVGLVLLLVLFGCMIAGGILSRAGPQAPFALGVVIAYVVAASTDWDWQMAAVTMPMLVCGAVLLGGRPVLDLTPGPARVTMMAAAAALMVCAGVGLMGNIWLDRSYAALDRHDPAGAVSAARSAHTWMPWSSEPLAQQARAQLAAGNTTGALRSVDAALSHAHDDWSLWLLRSKAQTGAARAASVQRAIALKPELRPLLNRYKRSIR